ncbi:TetR/AcrR family transcriptional regulator [Chryseobacterium suipulveris]|uniref:TetR/AcrR family transcriptional regulator n=1 Tax=Chryseobacterium suipulveris TaxID=2929800 RepID=A0ABY4BW76_9FLAO|nr:TetR/AcrR family transcriptional regulator [Chryseobacterium suipulveris]UOE40765.1 TetR/AcrR family transcriptional regulator [Chryseobacterium suipulveris]
MTLTEKQKEILEVAKTFFAERGYVETSMRDLAQQLNIKAASIYSHFKSKEEILTIISNEIYDMMKSNMEKIQQENLNPTDKFLLYVKLHILAVTNYQQSFRIYYKYWNLSKTNAAKYGLLNYEYFDFIKKLVYDVFPKLKEQVFYIPNATPLFIIDTLNSIPKIINPENPDIEGVVKDIQDRLMYGLPERHVIFHLN